MKATQDELVTLRKLFSLGLSPTDIQILYKASRSLHKQAEKDCNVGLTDKEQARRNKLFAFCTDIVHKVSTEHPKCVLELKTDPRAGCGLSFWCFGCEFYI